MNHASRVIDVRQTALGVKRLAFLERSKVAKSGVDKSIPAEPSTPVVATVLPSPELQDPDHAFLGSTINERKLRLALVVLAGLDRRLLTMGEAVEASRIVRAVFMVASGAGPRKVFHQLFSSRDGFPQGEQEPPSHSEGQERKNGN